MSHTAFQSTASRDFMSSSPSFEESRSVKVLNLPKEVAHESWLRVLFGPVGRIISISVKESDDGGEASIVFASPQQAEASRRLNGYVAMGRQIEVTRDPFSQRQGLPPPSFNQCDQANRQRGLPGMPRLRGAEVPPAHKNLYVLNLPLDVTTDQLAALFATYGTVVHCVILAMLDAQARRRGFIDMSSPQEAKEAIEGLNGFVWHGYPIEVSYAIVQRSGGPFDLAAGRNVIKRNVPRNRFNTGPRRIPSDSSLPVGPCSAFSSPSLLKGPNSIPSPGPPSPGFSDGSGSRSSCGGDLAADPNSIFITGLDPVAILDDDDLRHALEPYGEIAAASLSRDDSGISRGFGVVTFKKEIDATRARNGLDGKLMNGRKLVAQNLHYPVARSSVDPINFNRSLPALLPPPSPLPSPCPQGGFYNGVSNPALVQPVQRQGQQNHMVSNAFSASSNSFSRPSLPSVQPPATTLTQMVASGAPSVRGNVAFAQGSSNGFNVHQTESWLSGSTCFNTRPWLPFPLPRPSNGEDCENKQIEDVTNIGVHYSSAAHQGPLDSTYWKLGDPFEMCHSGHRANQHEGPPAGLGPSYGLHSEVFDIPRRNIERFAATSNPISDTWSLSRSNLVGIEQQSPESTRSAASTTSSASQLNTPEASGRLEFSGVCENVWGGLHRVPAPIWSPLATTRFTKDLQGEDLDRDKLCPSQSASPPKFVLSRRRAPLAPVGHEKSSSPLRDDTREHSTTDLDIGRLNISA